MFILKVGSQQEDIRASQKNFMDGFFHFATNIAVRHNHLNEYNTFIILRVKTSNESSVFKWSGKEFQDSYRLKPNL